MGSAYCVKSLTTWQVSESCMAAAAMYVHRKPVSKHMFSINSCPSFDSHR